MENVLQRKQYGAHIEALKSNTSDYPSYSLNGKIGASVSVQPMVGWCSKVDNGLNGAYWSCLTEVLKYICEQLDWYAFATIKL